MVKGQDSAQDLAVREKRRVGKTAVATATCSIRCGPIELVDKIIENELLPQPAAVHQQDMPAYLECQSMLCQLTTIATRKIQVVSRSSSASANWRMVTRTTPQQRFPSPAKSYSTKNGECRIKNL
ncbi:hypothetical protein BX661DRAFT_91700 [Kickxella alabastrina]|uniref:uncharacterized protein n=1 Tax=Kickxella alabastrina TaxID=61397 RepID=UPI00221FB674|nr:uncharacterized protein BX661DRAFT_91700 [Kickxella alabastrina]KAI7830997.1 hypothetical protein BX661DRAFT_91700 [Kickxella alabastrina]